MTAACSNLIVIKNVRCLGQSYDEQNCRFECSRLAREDYPTEMSAYFNSLIQTGVPVSRQNQNLSFKSTVRRGGRNAISQIFAPDPIN